MNLTKEDLIAKFLSNHNHFRKGNGFLSNQFKTDVDIVAEAKREAKKITKKDKNAIKNNYISALEEKIIGAKITEQRDFKDTGDQTLTIKSDKPLSPKQIDALVGVDNITRVVSMTWLKSNINGIWTYSIATKLLIADFYSKDELKDKLKELFPEQAEYLPVTFNTTPSTTNSLVIYISDDHVGMIINNSLFGNENSKESYKHRLNKIVQYVLSYNQLFEHIYIISLGDALNGWNNQTTRGGHMLNSVSNKDQFNMYISARKEFYDNLFTSFCANNYTLLEVNNSNHSGMGFSYMANAYLDLYIQNKYKNVNVINSENFIQDITLTTGQTLIICHGKDEKEQKNGFPLNLDPKTEIYFTDYILEQGINPKDENVMVVKGDLHRFNCNQGKNFNYVNIPSIANGSNWEENNFGNSKPGAVIDMFEQNDAEPLRKILRF